MNENVPAGEVVLAAGEGVPAYLGAAAALVVAAAVIGYLSVRFRVVPFVGFLLAGVLIGPAQFGLVANEEAVTAAAEVGVILLLFTIGIEFSSSGSPASGGGSCSAAGRRWRWPPPPASGWSPRSAATGAPGCSRGSSSPCPRPRSC